MSEYAPGDGSPSQHGSETSLHNASLDDAFNAANNVSTVIFFILFLILILSMAKYNINLSKLNRKHFVIYVNASNKVVVRLLFL